MGLKKFRKDAFIGLEESIEVLSEREVIVQLSVIETDEGVILVWLADIVAAPVGIVIARFVSKDVDEWQSAM